MIRFAFHLSIAIAITAYFGFAMSPLVPGLSPLDGAFQMLLIAGSGWALQLLLARVKLDHWREYAYALGPIMTWGVLLLLPASLGFVYFKWSAAWIPLFSVACSFSVMLMMHVRALKKLNLSRKWTSFWITNLLSTATAWFSIFHLIP